MKQVSLFIWLILAPTVATAQLTVAIGDFQNRTERIYLDSWEQKIPEFLHSELSQSPEIVLVERQNLKALMDEQALSMIGLVDSATAQQIGKLLSAQYVISGTINESGEWLRVDTKVINVVTGKIVSEKVQSNRTEYLDEMVKLLGQNLRYQLTGKGVYKAKLTMKKYPTPYFLAGTLGSGLATLLVHRNYLQKRDEYHKTTVLPKIDPLYQSANRYYKARTVLAGITGATAIDLIYCWLHNLSPDEILAQQPRALPFFDIQQEGEFAIGIQFSF